MERKELRNLQMKHVKRKWNGIAMEIGMDVSLSQRRGDTDKINNLGL